MNNPRRIKHFLSSFNAECLLIIPVSNIQLVSSTKTFSSEATLQVFFVGQSSRNLIIFYKIATKMGFPKGNRKI